MNWIPLILVLTHPKMDAEATMETFYAALMKASTLTTLMEAGPRWAMSLLMGKGAGNGRQWGHLSV